jgi:hypothetical protein
MVLFVVLHKTKNVDILFYWYIQFSKGESGGKAAEVALAIRGGHFEGIQCYEIVKPCCILYIT